MSSISGFNPCFDPFKELEAESNSNTSSFSEDTWSDCDDYSSDFPSESSDDSGSESEDLRSTPPRLTRLYSLIETVDPTYDLVHRQQQTVRKGVEAFRQLSPRKKADHGARIGRCVRRTLFPSEIRNAATHETQYARYKEAPALKFVLDEMGADLQADKCIVNIAHLRSPQKTRENKLTGLHLVPPNSKYREKLKQPVATAPNGVFATTYTLENCPEKYSTFYPDWVRDQDHLIELLDSSKTIHLAARRRLLLIDDQEHPPFHVEACHENSLVIPTAYPLMSFIRWEPNRVWALYDEQTVTSTQVRNAAFKALSSESDDENYSSMRYRTAHELVIDVAPSLNLIVKKGLLFRFDRATIDATQQRLSTAGASRKAVTLRS